MRQLGHLAVSRDAPATRGVQGPTPLTSVRASERIAESRFPRYSGPRRVASEYAWHGQRGTSALFSWAAFAEPR
jgi:hypothetical protein